MIEMTIYQRAMNNWDDIESVPCVDLASAMFSCMNSATASNDLESYRAMFKTLNHLFRLRAWQIFAAKCGCWGGQINHTPPTDHYRIEFFMVANRIFFDLIKECIDPSEL